MHKSVSPCVRPGVKLVLGSLSCRTATQRVRNASPKSAQSSDKTSGLGNPSVFLRHKRRTDTERFPRPGDTGSDF